MIPASSHVPLAVAESIDQRVYLHDITWSDYESLLAACGDQCGVRVTYLDGELELMTPSTDHESVKTRLARLLEAFAEEKEIERSGHPRHRPKAQRCG